MTRNQLEHIAQPIERRVDLKDERRRKSLRHKGRAVKRPGRLGVAS